jgi:DNA-binding FadR family transcriptional regulator
MPRAKRHRHHDLLEVEAAGLAAARRTRKHLAAINDGKCPFATSAVRV